MSLQRAIEIRRAILHFEDLDFIASGKNISFVVRSLLLEEQLKDEYNSIPLEIKRLYEKAVDSYCKILGKVTSGDNKLANDSTEQGENDRNSGSQISGVEQFVHSQKFSHNTTEAMISFIEHVALLSEIFSEENSAAIDASRFEKIEEALYED